MVPNVAVVLHDHEPPVTSDPSCLLFTSRAASTASSQDGQCRHQPLGRKEGSRYDQHRGIRPNDNFLGYAADIPGAITAPTVTAEGNQADFMVVDVLDNAIGCSTFGEVGINLQTGFAQASGDFMQICPSFSFADGKIQGIRGFERIMVRGSVQYIQQCNSST